MNIITKEFYCDLTEEDIARLGTENAHLQIEISRLEFERRLLNAKIKPLSERSDEIAHIIVSGQEKRGIECIWSYDWEKGIKTLHRSDTGEEIERDASKEHERQPSLPLTAPSAGPLLFSGHPKCIYVRSGNACASILCGHLPPIVPKLAKCDHPVEHHIVESNATTCGLCHKVLKKSDIIRQLQPVEATETIAMKSLPCDDPETYAAPCADCPDNDECGSIEDQEDCIENMKTPESIALADPADETEETAGNFDMDAPPNLAEEAAIAKKNRERQIDKNRKCCYPADRDIRVDGSIRTMFCRVCGLIAKKEDYSDLGNIKPVSFIVGERVELGQVAA